MRLLRLSLACLLFALVLPTAHADPDKESEIASLPADITALLEQAVAKGIHDTGYDDLYRAIVLEKGDVTPALEWLAKIHHPESKDDPARKRTAAWVAAHLTKRLGDLRTALGLAKQAATKDAPPVAAMLEANLQDMLGQAKDALAGYTALLPRLKDSARQATVRLRIALLAAGGQDSIKDALVGFAKEDGRSAEVRRRVAIVLALRQHPKEAAEIFAAEGEGTARFRQEIRLADWSLAADDAKGAQAHSWAALDSAELKRDRRYALSILVESHRKDKTLPALIERFKNTKDLDAQSRRVWIDLLRETGRIDEALSLFRQSADGNFTVDMRRELLEMCRESGKEDVLLTAYRDMIKEQPEIIEWREGLARHHLERSDRDAAIKVWRSYIEDPDLRLYLLAAAETLQSLGLDQLAVEACETAIREKQSPYAALIFLFHLHKRRGRMVEAEGTLARMDKLAPATAVERMQMAEAYEQLGKKDRAVEVLEKLADARGPNGSGEDLEMRLAWLLSEVDKEEKALDRWLGLWRRVESVPRRRYVEDRLMSVASRLGTLAKIAIELEDKLMAGTATKRDSGLLVRLYTKAKDPVSATEVIEEYLKKSGAGEVKTLVEKARVYLACTDYYSYEKTVEELIKVDPEGKGDYLRQLAMSYLERGKPDLAREVLLQLKAIEKGPDSAEFEAGVLSLAGLRPEAIVAYRRGIARFPDRIESFLLLANLLRDTGQQVRAIGMFQHLAATAEKDDLFTISIDGLLNMEAPAPVLRWARRTTLERLAGRHDKLYLYQLLSDLSEELNERDGMLRALEGALPIAGVQRSSLLRELMDLSRGGGRPGAFRPPGGAGVPSDANLKYGRRLIGLGEVAPPQVYLDLGTAFIAADEVSNARKTFALATEVPDYVGFQTQVAAAFEGARYLDEALQTYERLLISQAGDVPLLVKVAELHEQLGRDERAVELYSRAMDYMLARRLLSTITKKKEKADPFAWWGPRNVDEFDQHYPRVLNGLLTVLDAGPGAEALLAQHRKALDEDIEHIREDVAKDVEQANTLAAYPRVASRVRLYRRVAIAAGRSDLADDADLIVLGLFTKDEKLLPALVRERLDWGLIASARRILKDSAVPEEQKAKLRFLVGAGSTEGAAFVPVPQAARLYLPLLAAGETEQARTLLRRVDFSSLTKDDIEHMPVLLSAAVQMQDGDQALAIARHWVRTLIKTDKQGRNYWSVSPMVQRIGALIQKEKFRSFCQYIVGLIISDMEKAGNWLNLIPMLQANFERPLLEPDQIQGLLEKVDGNRWYWVGSFFAIVPEKDRAAALRKLLPKVPKTRRMQFLLSLLQQMEDEISADFGDFISASFDAALDEVDQKDQFAFYSFTMLANSDKNLDLRLRIAKLPIAKGIKNDLVKSAHAILLQKMGRADEALADALDVYGNLLAKPQNDYRANMARQNLTNVFLPKHTDAFLAHIDKLAKEGARGADVTRRRLEIARQSPDPDTYLAALRQAVTDHPEDDGFRNQLYYQLNRSGKRLEAIQLLVTMSEKKPKDVNLKRRVMSGWRQLNRPIEALAVKQEIDALAKQSLTGAPKDEKEAAKKVKRANINDLKKAVDEERFADATTMLRQLWRTFPVGMGTNRFGRIWYGNRNYTWPAAARTLTDAEKEANKLRARGGLAGWTDELTKPVERKSMYEALSEHEFAEPEMRRQLRTWGGMQLSQGGPLITGVAKGMVARHGRLKAASSLVAQIAAGRAGKLEYALLLAMLEDDTEGTGIDAEAFLSDLARTVPPNDVGQVQRLARIYARMGGAEEAARLYLWCAAQSPASGRGVSYRVVNGVLMPQGGGGNIYQIVKEVGTELKGDLRLATIERILELADPGTDDRWGPTSRDGYESLVLRTWIDVLGSEQALAKCRAICADVPNLENGLRRTTARYAAALLARAGEHDAALRCLEVAVCSLDAPSSTPRHWQSWYKRHGSLGYDDIRRLFPADTSDWADAAAWRAVAQDAFVEWIDAERASAASLFRPLAILAVRRANAGQAAKATALAERLEKVAAERSSDMLWAIDVRRELGQDERAYELERGLLEKGQLIVTRLREVLERIAERDGPEEALEVAENAARTSHHPQLLDALVQLATDADDVVQIAHWDSVRKRAADAREALKPKKTK